MSITMKRNRTWMIIGAVLAVSALIGWIVPNIAFSANTKSKTKKAAVNNGKTCLSEGCPQKSRCLVVNDKPQCVISTKAGTNKAKKTKNRRDVKQNRQQLKNKLTRKRGTRVHDSKKNPPACIDKQCPPGTRCQSVGNKAQCVKVTKLNTNKGVTRKSVTKKGVTKKGVTKKGVTKKGRFGDRDPAVCVNKQCPPETRCIMVSGHPQCIMAGTLRPNARRKRSGTKNAYKLKTNRAHKLKTNRARPALSNRDKVKFKPRKVLPKVRK